MRIKGQTASRFSFFLLVIFIFILCLSSFPALGDPGESVQCTPTHDAHVDEANPTMNFGGTAFVHVGVSSVEFPGDVFTYIKFDLSSVPDGSTVTGATLGMYLDSASGLTGGVEIHASKVNPPVWEQNTITWNNKPGWDSSFSSTSVSTSPGWYEWTVPASVVQFWVDNTYGNHGIVLHWSGSLEYFDRIFQGQGMALGPRLQVNYDAPTTPTPADWIPTTTPATPAVTTTLTWPTPIDDDVPPEIEWLEAPTEGTAGTPVLISARATDDREISSLQIWVGGTMEETCTPTGTDLTTVDCTFDDTLEPGSHVYYALAYDTAGNGVSSTIQSIDIPYGVDAPEIEVTWFPSNPNKCDYVTFTIRVSGDELWNVNLLRFLYNDHLYVDNPSIPRGDDSYSISIDYRVSLDTSYISYYAYVGMENGQYNTDSGSVSLNPCSNSIQDAGEGDVDCGGDCISVCRECLGDFTYEDYWLSIDGSSIYHFNLSNTTEQALAISLAGDALREYSDHTGIPVASLDTSDEYMLAVAYYVDQHMTWTSDTDWSLGWDGAHGFYRSVTESGARGCGNTYCGDCDDFATLRMTLLFALGVSEECVYMLHGPSHFYNYVYYEGKFRIMDYGELGRYFETRWDPHATDKVALPGGFNDNTDYMPYNYPGVGGCPACGWNYTTVYCDVCP